MHPYCLVHSSWSRKDHRCWSPQRTKCAAGLIIALLDLDGTYKPNKKNIGAQHCSDARCTCPKAWLRPVMNIVGVVSARPLCTQCCFLLHSQSHCYLWLLHCLPVTEHAVSHILSVAHIISVVSTCSACAQRGFLLQARPHSCLWLLCGFPGKAMCGSQQ